MEDLSCFQMRIQNDETSDFNTKNGPPFYRTRCNSSFCREYLFIFFQATIIDLNNVNARTIMAHLKTIIGRRTFKTVYFESASSEMVKLCSDALDLCQISLLDFSPKEEGQIDR